MVPTIKAHFIADSSLLSVVQGSALMKATYTTTKEAYNNE